MTLCSHTFTSLLFLPLDEVYGWERSAKEHFYCNKMKIRTVRQVIMISKEQANSLAILKTYNVNISQFIRQSILEKLKRDWKEIKESKNKEYCPF